MAILLTDYKQTQSFINDTEEIIERLSSKATDNDVAVLEKLIKNFQIKIEDFNRENRKLNIGVVGQVKAGKSSFLNTLLFNGKEILPKAATPKTATLTKMEYSERNIIQVEYYSVEEWKNLVEKAKTDLEGEIYTSAREIVGMVRHNGLDPIHYLEMGTEWIEFESYDDLIANLNNYVGDDGMFTPIVKAVTLYLNKDEFKGLSIVDTPGLNDPIVSRTIRTKEFIEVCDVVFFLSTAVPFLDKSDWILLSSQLPQKGVKKLILVASKYDSVIRDILIKPNDDDVFGADDIFDDENSAYNIPEACKKTKNQLKEHAEKTVEKFIQDLTLRESSAELIEVIKQCSNPIFVSAIACNMARKKEDDYTQEERNLYSYFKQFSDDIERDLKLLGNLDELNTIFSSVVMEKEKILEQKAKSFIPTAVAELCACLEEFKEKASKRLSVLENNDRDTILGKKKLVEGQINSIKADIAMVFGELNAKLEIEKAEGVREIREASKDYLDVRERTGSVTRHGSYTTGHLWWKKTEHYTYEEHYSYCIAADAIENLQKFSIEAVNQVEKVFSDALGLKDIKRRLLNVVVKNFDVGSEKYDYALFHILVEETVAQIEFPLFNIDISDVMNEITAKFTGEITSAGQKTELATALSKAVSKTYDALCRKLTFSVVEFKAEMEKIAKIVESSLLENINNEFKILEAQCEHKEKEIAKYKAYIELLDKEMEQL